MPSNAADVHTESDDEDPTELETDIEGLARRIVRAVRNYTRGLPGRWVPVMIIAEMLDLKDEGATTAAVQFAVDQGWLDEFGGHSSIRLTSAGRGIR